MNKMTTRQEKIETLKDFGQRIIDSEDSITAYPVFYVCEYDYRVSPPHYGEFDADRFPAVESDYVHRIRRKVVPFFSREAAENFIERARHHFDEPHIYEDSLKTPSSGSDEMIVIRNILVQLAAEEDDR